VASGLLGDLGGLDARSQLLGRREEGSEGRECLGWVVGRQVVERDGVELGAEVGEVGPDLDRVEVGDDEERRVAQVLAVAEQLEVGGLEVLALALVLPAEEVLLPDVREPVAAGGLGDGLLEGVGLAGRIRLVGRRLAEHPAQVDEVFLGGGLLLRRVVAPLLGELARRQGRLGHGPLPRLFKKPSIQRRVYGRGRHVQADGQPNPGGVADKPRCSAPPEDGTHGEVLGSQLSSGLGLTCQGP